MVEAVSERRNEADSELRALDVECWELAEF
jgi:hypothetical protein